MILPSTTVRILSFCNLFKVFDKSTPSSSPGALEITRYPLGFTVVSYGGYFSKNSRKPISPKNVQPEKKFFHLKSP